MKTYNGYVILNPYTDLDFFVQYPNGDDMRLRLMCAGPEGSLFFFPEHYPISTALDDRDGHPCTPYSPAYSALADAMADIDAWLLVDSARQAKRVARFETDNELAALAVVEAHL